MIWNFIGIPDDSLENFKVWLGVAVLSNVLVASAYGLFFSILFQSDNIALQVSNAFLGGLYFSSGVFANDKFGNNWFLDFCKLISPFAYSTQAKMILFLKGLDPEVQTKLLEFYNMNDGLEYCI